ncbi:MAG: LacI family DNA-binding transcriptional regulator [Streptosporangiales bacterium]|nr:LacI family DNA-binding transcriptional regulator [Streptosporangiales bacterium]
MSKVLNGDESLRIRPETRDRVRRAVERLGYRPSAVARSLRMSETGTIGLVLPAFDNPIWSVIVQGVEEEADRRGFSLLTGTAPAGSGRMARFVDLARRGAVDGLLVTADLDDADVPPPDSGVRWLMVNRSTGSSRRHVLLDDSRGAQLATRNLLDLGHREIAHLAGPPEVDSTRRRTEGVVTCLAEEGLDPVAVVPGALTLDGGEAAMDELLALDPPPTAVVVGNVVTAAGALAAARRAGVVVPRDLSVIAVHDHPLARAFAPALTTVRIHTACRRSAPRRAAHPVRRGCAAPTSRSRTGRCRGWLALPPAHHRRWRPSGNGSASLSPPSVARPSRPVVPRPPGRPVPAMAAVPPAARTPASATPPAGPHAATPPTPSVRSAHR